MAIGEEPLTAVVNIQISVAFSSSYLHFQLLILSVFNDFATYIPVCSTQMATTASKRLCWVGMQKKRQLFWVELLQFPIKKCMGTEKNVVYTQKLFLNSSKCCCMLLKWGVSCRKCNSVVVVAVLLLLLYTSMLWKAVINFMQ